MNNHHVIAASHQLNATTVMASNFTHQNLLEKPDTVRSSGVAKQLEPERPTWVAPKKFKASELAKMILPETRFAVSNFLPEGISILAGKPKLGKSWLILNVAVRIARGETVLGEHTEQGSVLYLALEDNARRLQNRLTQLAPDKNWDNLEFWTECPRQDQGGLEEIRTWLEATPDAKMVVIDVWGRFEPAKSSGKSDYSHVTEAIQALQQLAFKHHVGVVLVCHTRKGDKDMVQDAFDEVLGSTGITSNADATLVLTRARMEKQAILKVTGRDIREREINLGFDDQTGEWSPTDAVVEAVLPPEQQKVLDAIRQGHMTPTALENALGKKRTAIMGLLKTLHDSSRIVKEGPGKYRCARTGQTGPDMTDNADIVTATHNGSDMTDIDDLPGIVPLMSTEMINSADTNMVNDYSDLV